MGKGTRFNRTSINPDAVLEVALLIYLPVGKKETFTGEGQNMSLVVDSFLGAGQGEKQVSQIPALSSH